MRPVSSEPAGDVPETLLQLLSDETRVVVSEPLGELPGVWNEVHESSYGIVRPGQDELATLIPRTP